MVPGITEPKPEVRETLTSSAPLQELKSYVESFSSRSLGRKVIVCLSTRNERWEPGWVARGGQAFSGPAPLHCTECQRTKR